nr:hypothetical protein [Tanacetum cinerariifolium]
MQEVILFYNGLEVPTRQILDSKGAIPTKTTIDAKVATQEIAKYSQKWHNRTSRTRSTESSDGLAAIQAQLNNLGREIKKVNKKEVILFYNGLEVPTRQILDSKGAIPTKTTVDAKVATQEIAEYFQKWHNRTSRTRSTKTSDGLAAIQAQVNNLGREIKKVNKKVYAAQVGSALGFYQRNNANPSYQERRQSTEESLSKFMNESAKRHEENYNMIKEIRASTDAAIKNQEALIKALEIQVGQMSKKKGSYGLQDLDAYSIITTLRDDFLFKKEKDPGSFTLPCYINNVCFENSLAELGASVSVMPLLTYLNLGLGKLAHTKLTVELVDRTVKHLKGTDENVLVEICKFVFPTDFILLDMPEDAMFP